MSAVPLVFEVTEADRGARLDVFVAAHLPSVSRSRAAALVTSGHVTVNGARSKVAHRLLPSDLVSVEVPAAEPAVPQAEDLPLAVLFEDRDVVVLNKAAGMVVHPAAGHRSGTMVNALLHHVDDLQGVGGELRPGLVHRLDKDTSGVMVVAKSDEALQSLQASFKDRAVSKKYLALVAGQPPERGTFETLYGRHPKHRLRFSSKVTQGKHAVTHYEVKRRFARAALVEVELLTGRTHQIRVHFADAGYPLVSDALYAPKRAQWPDVIARQALHAWKLTFPHPRTGKVKTFTAAPPPDFAAAERLLAGE